MSTLHNRAHRQRQIALRIRSRMIPHLSAEAFEIDEQIHIWRGEQSNKQATSSRFQIRPERRRAQTSFGEHRQASSNHCVLLVGRHELGMITEAELHRHKQCKLATQHRGTSNADGLLPCERFDQPLPRNPTQHLRRLTPRKTMMLYYDSSTRANV